MATIFEALTIAIQHQQAGRLQAAEQIYRQILAIEPNQPDAIHFLGLIAHQVGQHELAVEYIQRAIRIRGDAACFHGNLGAVYRAWGRVPEAVACFRRALELEPDNADTHNNLALALEDQGKVDEAIACYRRAVAVKPDFAKAHTNLGIVLREQGKLDEAAACFRRALELKPDYFTAHGNLGRALQDQGKLDEAIACYRRALELKPDHFEAHANLGSALQNQRKLDEAIAAYRRALELKPDYAEAHTNLGAAFMDQGKVEEAIACCRRALELKPDLAAAHNNLGLAFKHQGKLNEAITAYRRALELRPDYFEAHTNLGAAFIGQGKLDEAIDACRRALELKPDYAEAYDNLGVAFKDQGKLDEAIAACRQALELQPDNFAAHNNLGTALRGQGKLEEAIACYRRALELKPDYAAMHHNLGIALRDQGKLDEAIACCRRALELKPDFAEAHANLGLVLQDQGKLDEAIACYRRALALKPDFAAAHANLGLALKDRWKSSNVAQPLVKMFSDWLRARPQNELFETAAFFETTPEALEVLQRTQQQSMSAGRGSAFMDRMGTIHAYLHHTLAPAARDSHIMAGSDGGTLVNQQELFLDLQRDPCFADFINEMPRLLTDASLSMYSEFAATLPAATGEDRVVSPDKEDAREVERFLHLLCCQAEMVEECLYYSENCPTLELEICCDTHVLHSAATALYLDFLQRRYPALLVPPPPDDDSALDAVSRGFARLLAILDEIRGRLQEAKRAPRTASLENFCRVSGNLLLQLSEFTKWLSTMTDVGGGFDFAESVVGEFGVIKRSLDCQRWVRATSITCYGQRGCVDSIQTISTWNTPSLGHGIATILETYDADEQGSFYLSLGFGSCRHTPNGEPVPNNFMFISPVHVLGKDHPLSLVMERVALLGDGSHVFAVDLQRRIDWLGTAEENDMPLRTILYTDEARDRGVAFNLFSKPEADRLTLRGPLAPMTGKHEGIYAILRAIEYELPNDSDGSPLPPSQLVMEILDEGDDRDDEDEEVLPPAPVEDGQRARRLGRGPVGAGSR